MLLGSVSAILACMFVRCIGTYSEDWVRMVHDSLAPYFGWSISGTGPTQSPEADEDEETADKKRGEADGAGPDQAEATEDEDAVTDSTHEKD